MNEPIGFSASSEQTVYEFARASAIEGWWWWALLLASLSFLLYGCVKYYRRDVKELPSSVRFSLVFLRVISVFALVFFFFDLQRRTQREITRSSEVVVLVDTSQSMSLAESERVGSDARATRAAKLLGQSELLEQFGDDHRVSVYAFGDSPEPILLEARGGVQDDAAASDAASDAADPGNNQNDTTSGIRPSDESKISSLAVLGMVLITLAVILSFASLLWGGLKGVSRRNWGRDASRNQSETGTSSTNTASSGVMSDPLGFLIASTAVILVAGVCLAGAGYTVNTEQSFLSQVGFTVTDGAEATQPDERDLPLGDQDETIDSIRVLDWTESVAAAASQSRIGDAIASVLGNHDPTTLAGVMLITDGQNNGGAKLNAAMASAKRNEVSIYPVGLGSSRSPVNVRVVDLDAPRRVYPNDNFSISAVLQATGGDDLEVTLQLLDGSDLSGTGGGADSEIPTDVIDSQKVKIAGDGTLAGVKFELEPEAVGRRRLAVRVIPPQEDQNELDNVRDARYEVVARKLRVLTIAGGPTREYRFVRNLLYREKSIRLDTWLQTGQPGMSQDADKLLTEFPATAAELFEYDAIAMFDPDWTAFSAESLELMDRWVASQAGGLIIVGGPVYHPRWLKLRTDPRVSRIAGFFPVTFSKRGLVMGSGREGGQTSWTPSFTPEARRAEFLWVTDDAKTSFETWDQFGGVYDYVGSKAAKPVAKVYSYFSDPTAQIGESKPVYMASQFYGAGKVYFQGSGEMWRLRRESVSFFDRFYTKLVRWVCEGRLLRDSNRGVLLVDNPRAMVGDTITVRAVLTDEQFEPLNVPEVTANLLSPTGRISVVRLEPLEGEARPGTYSGRFVVRAAGNHELRLTLGDALDEQLFRQNVQVRLPTVELERPRRNDKQLEQLAATTGGKYWKVDPGLTNDALVSELSDTIRPQPQTTVLPGTPDTMFNERRNAMLLWLIASTLSMEWVVRRLHRLA